MNKLKDFIYDMKPVSFDFSDSIQNELAPKFYNLMLKGIVRAGTPTEVFEDYEEYSAPAWMVKNPKKTFLLRVRGESMIDALIGDGDIIVVERRPTARTGEIVVAVLDGEITVKKFFKTDDRIELHPENKTMEPISIVGKDFLLYGIVVGVMRSY